MFNEPLFSVLVANYNNGHFICEAINSVQTQTYENWEIVIVDDLSTDNSVEIIKKYLTNDKIRLYINNKNEGCGFTKNRCIEHSMGEICGFLDPDDILSDNALSVMVNEHRKNTDSSLVYSNCFYCDEKLSNPKINKNKTVPVTSDYLSLAYKFPTISHFASFKSGLFNKTEGINPNLKKAVDQDLYYKCEEVGKLTYIDENLYYYRFHKGSISLFNNHIKAIAWHLAVAMDACKRRGIAFENVISDMLFNIFIDSYRKSIQYKIGSFILKPIFLLQKATNVILKTK